jgi:hypothetical protein
MTRRRLLMAVVLLAACADRDLSRNAMSSIRYPAAATLSPRPVLVTRDSVQVFNGGYGSGLTRHPAEAGLFYLLTDRGPNFQMEAEDQKTFPAPSYTPRIGLFRLNDSVLTLERSIELRDETGRLLNGLPNPPGRGGTGETALDTLGRTIPPDTAGLDPEGLSALADGTFWVSDEYGPHLLHLDSNGKTIERLSPFSSGRSLPAVFLKRRPNRGLENLAVTPSQRTLVAMLEGPLDNPRAAGRISRVIRMVSVDLASGETRQFVYLSEDVAVTTNGMTALTESQFLVLERDDKFPGDSADPSWVKRVYRIDLSAATDISDPANGERGRLFAGKTVEELTPEELRAGGVVPVRKTLVIDLLAADLAYPHNKPEGIAVVDALTIAVSNDDDFGITDDGKGRMLTKMLPLTGQPDETMVRFFRLTHPLY